jgi:HD-GYP domain-containing protein (c-di-GMP phosphodiesterase class II)
MKQIRIDILIRVFSEALDIVEAGLLGASVYHSKRIGALVAAMGKTLGYDDDSLSAIATAAMFHDNALTEYILSEREREDGESDENMRLHSEYGQRNVEWLPFKKDVTGYVLYHHERADGSGPFGKKKGEYPPEAGLISLADIVDVAQRLQTKHARDLPALHEYIRSLADIGYDKDDIETLVGVLDADMLTALKNENLNATLDRLIPVWTADIEDPSVVRIAGMISRIIDYKSKFTKKHTMRVANAAWIMSEYYGAPPAERAQVYLAAAMHDIGKIVVATEIIEKPGGLTDEEFEEIKKHVNQTLEWLSHVDGLEQVAEWAGNHHEKLNGRGYGRGVDEAGLDFNSRLIACLDIYEAVSAERPYHPARSHADTMPILYDMAEDGLIDAGIAADIGLVLAPYDGKELPLPEPIREIPR